MLGIKILNIQTNKVSAVVGKQENLRFMNIALYQGAPRKKTLVTLEMAASENTVLKDSEQIDPALFCTSYKKNRFYSITRREPDSTQSGGSRDIFNEKPTKEESTVAAATNQKEVTTSCVLHTTFGDIYIILYPDLAPKAVKNFTEHSKSGKIMI